MKEREKKSGPFVLAVDVEATCDDKGAVPRDDMEIIEIGAVLLDRHWDIADDFQTFIKPAVHPVLTAFCTKLTTIRQSDVDNAPDAETAFRALQRWLDSYRPHSWYSCGNYDRTQFRRDCQRARLPWPLPRNHIDAKDVYRDRYGRKMKGLYPAVAEAGLDWIGTHHRGIDDARNLGRLLRHLYVN